MFGDEDRVVTYSSAVCYFDGEREYVEEAEVEVALLWADKHKLLIPLGSAMDNLCRRLEEDLDLSLNDPDAQALTADEMDAIDEDEAMMIDGMEFVDAEPVSATGAGASWVVQGSAGSDEDATTATDSSTSSSSSSSSSMGNLNNPKSVKSKASALQQKKLRAVRSKGQSRLKEQLLKNGRVLPNNILDVSAFMDSMIDIDLMDACAAELAAKFVRLRPSKSEL